MRLILGLALALSACSYRGTAKNFTPTELTQDAGWIAIGDVPVVLQNADAEGGAAALAMVLNYWKRPTSVADVVHAYPELTETGTMKAGDLRDYAEHQGLTAFLFRGELMVLEHELTQQRPVIVGLIKRYSVNDLRAHYEVVVGYHPKKRLVLTLDPEHGWRENTLDGFFAEWAPSEKLTLVMFAP